MKNKYLEYLKKNKVLIGILVILCISFLYYALVYEENAVVQLDQTQTELVTLQTEFNTLSQEHETLLEQCGEVSESYGKLVQGVDEEIETTIDMIEEYQDEMEVSLAWFSENEEWEGLGDEFYTRSFERVCSNINSNRCEIDLNCIVSYNDCHENLKYLYDINEELISVEDFYSKGGGDCEDFAMFFKAEYNYLMNRCLENEQENITLVSWKHSDKSWDEVYLKFCSDEYYYYYLPYAKETPLPQNYIYSNIVCGSIYDLNTGEVGGHCLNAFTKEKIKSIEDIEEMLDGAPLVEPQTGEYYGLINDESSGVYVFDEDKNYLSYIDMVITNEDHFLYSEEYHQWLGYAYFYDELEESKEYLLHPTEVTPY